MFKVEALAHTLADLQPGAKAKTLADTLAEISRHTNHCYWYWSRLADTLTEVKAETLVHTIGDVDPKALVGRKANMLDEVDAKTLGDKLGVLSAKAPRNAG